MAIKVIVRKPAESHKKEHIPLVYAHFSPHHPSHLVAVFTAIKSKKCNFQLCE